MTQLPRFGVELRLPSSKRDYEVITPMMEEMLAVVLAEIDRNAPGVAMYGNSRIGKTRAMDYVTAQVRKKYPSLLILSAIMKSRKGGSDTRFFKSLAADFDLNISLDGDGDDLRTEIVRYILTRCATNNDSRVLILIDEAQRMRHYEYSYLIDLTNHLEKYGMSPTVIQCAQPELMDMRNELGRSRRRDIIGRFLESPIHLKGILSKEDLQTIMSQYEFSAAMQFPRNSGLCIMEAYAPAQYRNGVRISPSHETLWEAITDLAQSLRRTPEIGMQSLTRAIELALIDVATKDICVAKNRSGIIELEFNKESWKELLHEAGYVQHLLLTHDELSIVEGRNDG